VKIKRKIKGKTNHYPVYSKEEASAKKIQYVPWKQAEVGEWALTDDGYVSECFDRKSYTDKAGHVKTFIKLTCGVGWDSSFSKINFLVNHEYGVYSKTNPKRTWDEEENGKTRSKNTVNAYANMLLGSNAVDFNVLGQIYRPNQQTPAATVRRFSSKSDKTHG